MFDETDEVGGSTDAMKDGFVYLTATAEQYCRVNIRRKERDAHLAYLSGDSRRREDNPAVVKDGSKNSGNGSGNGTVSSLSLELSLRSVLHREVPRVERI